MAELTGKIEFSDGSELFVQLEDDGTSRHLASAQSDFFAGKFDLIKTAIEHVASSVRDSIKSVAPDRASVELKFGFKASTDGTLTALLCKGEGSGSVKVTLDWNFENRTV